MPQQITDLSDLLPEPKQIRFKPDGETYLLPGDIPAPLLLKVQAASDIDDDSKVQGIYDEILELFRVHQPDLDELDATFAQVFAVIPRVYMGAQPDPTRAPAKRTGAPKKKASTATRSRSR